MSTPKPLQEFKDLLLASEEIKTLIADHYGPDARECLTRFEGGDIADLLDLIENNKQDLSGSPEDTIDAAAPDDDIFQIELWSTGPVYWIRANEFDDIGYFASLADARRHAETEFESFISELADREAEEEEFDDDEADEGKGDD